MTTTRPPRRFLAAAAAAGIAAALSPWPAPAPAVPAVPVPAASVPAGPLDTASALAPSALAPSAPAARIAAASAGHGTAAGVPAAPASGGPAAPPSDGSAAAVRCVAGRYAAEAGAEVMHVNRLDLGPAGHPGAALGDVGVGEARSAVVAQTATSAAAVRMLAGVPSSGVAPTGVPPGGPAPAGVPSGGPAPTGVPSDGPAPTSGSPGELTRPVWQRAAPAGAVAAGARVGSGAVGPVSVGDGSATSRARWDSAMGCGAATGEITQARAVLDGAGLLTDDSGRALLRVPQRVEARSTTALHRRGSAVHMVARAGVSTRVVELLDGAVRVAVVRAPTLSTSISAAGAAEVRYVPAVLEVSGAGFGTARLTTPGDSVEIPVAGVPGDPLQRLAARLTAGALEGMLPGPPPALPVPPAPGTPGFSDRSRSVPDPHRRDVAGPGDDPRSTVRVSIGEARQAVSGNAVAARVAAMHVEITAGTGITAGTATVVHDAGDSGVAGARDAPRARQIARSRNGGGTGAPGGTVLDVDLGLLQSAAVAPDPDGTAPVDPTGGDRPEPASRLGLPVTGPRADPTVVAGTVLLATGALTLVLSLRRRHPRT